MPPAVKAPKSTKSSGSSKGKGKGKKTDSPEDVEKPGHPEDICPMVLTSATQELFGCLADEDVTGESPYKLLQKDDIIQDIKTRAAVSDFSPVKQIVLDYPEDEILLVFDRDFTYGQSFYLVLTPEAKGRILNPPEPETPEVLENEVKKTPEPKKWISQGSEKEIEKESLRETREKLCFKFSRVRRKFGAQVFYSDRSPADAKDGFLECPSHTDSRFSIKQMQRDCGLLAIPILRSSCAQTQWKIQKNMSTQSMPRDSNDEERESILRSKSMKDFLTDSLTPRVSSTLQHTEIANVTINDWTALRPGVEDSDCSGHVSESLMLFRAIADQMYIKDKKISCINWHPTIYGVIAVALTEKIQAQSEASTNFVASPSLVLFYSFSNTSGPQLLLECPDDIYAFEFSPSDPNIIAGGCKNGQVVLWDISAYVTHLEGVQPGSKNSSVNTVTFELNDNKENKTPAVCYCAVSSVESSHKAPITDVQWLPPTFEVTKTGLAVENKNNLSVQIVTCSPDCAIKFWDVRVSKQTSHSATSKKQRADQKNQLTPYLVPETFKHLDRTWKPLFKVSLPKIDTSGEYAPLKFSLEHYTCDDNNTGGTTEDANENDDSSEVIPDYSQLRVPSAKTLTTLEDVNTKIFIGTEDGEIVYTDWKMGKDDSGRFKSEKPLHCSNIHHWFVNTVQRSPFFKDIILTVGAWDFAIWREGVLDGPIIQSPSSEQAYTVGCWSVTRPAIIFIGREDSSIEVWSFLQQSGEPVQVFANVTKSRITCIKPWASITTKQHFLAVSDDLGTVSVFRLPKSLYVPLRSEHSHLRKHFEREENRLKDLMMRKEQWLIEMKEAEERKKKTDLDKPEKTLEEEEEEDMKAYKEYLVLEEKILKDIGVWQDPDHKV
ncbi:dynein intermediate chain 3, axonemal [Cheilinus undulatus]|uniref:dynein intermediate chain 3, axonemal n=1 Tax=Cheilinus undulatus TaxID=241271 RepID=UPI001BD5687D|nr:dynein intermediate chain 3, axonemal [Cheilinus undulatus]